MGYGKCIYCQFYSLKMLATERHQLTPVFNVDVTLKTIKFFKIKQISKYFVPLRSLCSYHSKNIGQHLYFYMHNMLTQCMGANAEPCMVPICKMQQEM